MDENEYASIQEARNRASKMYETMEASDPSTLTLGRRTASLSKTAKCNTAPLQMSHLGHGTAERKVSQYRYSEDTSDPGSNRQQFFVVDTGACRDAAGVESRYSN